MDNVKYNILFLLLLLSICDTSVDGSKLLLVINVYNVGHVKTPSFHGKLGFLKPI